MKLKTPLILLLIIFTISFESLAQQGDPWIIQAYKELYNRQPSSTELNIKNYNQGSWSNYAELKNYVLTYKSGGLKGDPWIFQIYSELYNRQPNALELNIKNYNSGSWNNYNELKQYIQHFQTSLKQAGITISTAIVKDVAIIGISQNGQQIAVAALSTNAGQIIASNGNAIISGGAGNIISGGAGNIISGGAGNVLANDGASIKISSAMGGIGFGSSYSLQSENSRVVKSGKGALIITKK